MQVLHNNAQTHKNTHHAINQGSGVKLSRSVLYHIVIIIIVSTSFAACFCV